MASPRITYGIEVKHEGLNKYRHIRGSDRYIVEQKARMLQRQWDDEWERKQEKEQQRTIKQQIIETKTRRKEEQLAAKEAKQNDAEQRSLAAQAELDNIRNTLRHTLSVNDEIDWDSLKVKQLFDKTPPIYTPPTPRWIPPYIEEEIPPKPVASMPEYQPKLGWLTNIFPWIKRSRLHRAELQLLNDQRMWESAKIEIEWRNQGAVARHHEAIKLADEEHLQALTLYEKEYQHLLEKHKQELAKFEERKASINHVIDEKHRQYLAGEAGAIIDYCDMVLSKSKYPDTFPHDFDLDYNRETRILVIDYCLPIIENMSKIKEARYLKSKDDFKEIYLSDKEQESLYNNLLYQLSLRTIHEVFEADSINAIDAIVLNGITAFIEKSSGQEVTACILSIQAHKDEFMAINLANVDPKICFKSLKGVGSSQLHTLTPVPPIIAIDREDRRFVSAYGVADELDEYTNIATMAWEDFEHLIRELFQKEFQQSGGECKVTRASRDGGVDAIAFDPDPIRGGKIVIQAKRYTKTVGVSAVRDLYGTVVNEGATKGILVTTADYGPDSYEFAKGKPLTLLNGANLLHLLEKHGHKAKIDLQAARLAIG